MTRSFYPIFLIYFIKCERWITFLSHISLIWIQEGRGRSRKSRMGPALASTSKLSGSAFATKQPTLTQFTESRKESDRKDESWQENTKRLAEVIALDFEPFSIVDRVGFRRYSAGLEPRYQPLCCWYLSETAIPSMYKDVKDKIQGLLNDTDHVSFTADIWTSPDNNQAL